jgi:hypothetical protein
MTGGSRTAPRERESRGGNGGSARLGLLFGVYLVAAGLGYVLGARGLLPFDRCARFLTASPSPAARVGWVLQQETPRAAPGAWAALGPDVAAVRAAWKPPGRDAFDLVAAVRGLDNGGAPAWAKAEQLCRALKWSRCDQPALEELRKRSRP